MVPKVVHVIAHEVLQRRGLALRTAFQASSWRLWRERGSSWTFAGVASITRARRLHSPTSAPPRAQRYASAPWAELVGLWSNFNLHLARVIEATPANVRLQPRSRHNLHELAWKAAPQSEPATLEYFMRDYVDHLRHHIAQIFPPA